MILTATRLAMLQMTYLQHGKTVASPFQRSQGSASANQSKPVPALLSTPWISCLQHRWKHFYRWKWFLVTEMSLVSLCPNTSCKTIFSHSKAHLVFGAVMPLPIFERRILLQFFDWKMVSCKKTFNVRFSITGMKTISCMEDQIQCESYSMSRLCTVMQWAKL